LISLTACSSNQPPSDTGGNTQAPAENEKIVITGADIGEKDVFISDIMKLPSFEKEVVSVNSAGNENRFTVKGALLSDILKTLGKDQKTLSSIRLVAGDGYMMEVPSEVLAIRDIIIAYEMDGQPLEEKTRPARVIIPEERAMFWVRNLIKIEILEAREALALSTLFILETAIQNIEQHDYTYYESLDKAIVAGDLFKDMVINGSGDTVYMKAVDGLEKNEKVEVFKKGYIKFTGVEAPAFVSPDIPKGMYVKDILWLSKGDIGYFSFERGLDYLSLNKIEDREGIRLQEIFQEVFMVDSEVYLFTAADGYVVEINKEDISKGILFLRDSGEVSVMFEGLPRNTTVRDLLSIQGLK
jgi:hypothetical protein